MRNTPEVTQKAYERRQVQCFLDSARLGSEWTLEDSERPDFLLANGHHRIGVEVSDLFWDVLPPRRPGETRKEKVCDEAHRSWAGMGGPHVSVRVEFDPTRTLTKHYLSFVAQGLVDLAGSCLPAAGQAIAIERCSSTIVPGQCLAIRISRPIEATRSYWHAAGADWLPDLTRGRIQQRLDAKETRLPCYREDVDEHWLVLITNPFQLSMAFEVPDATRRAVYRSSFDRVFVLNVYTGDLIEPELSGTESARAALTAG